jgi:hypothetical protein
VEIDDFSHLMVHNPDRLAGGRSAVRHIQWRVAHRGADCFAAVAGRDRAGRGRASESVFGGWQPPPAVSSQ